LYCIFFKYYFKAVSYKKGLMCTPRLKTVVAGYQIFKRKLDSTWKRDWAISKWNCRILQYSSWPIKKSQYLVIVY